MIDFLLQLQSDVEFDVRRYHNETPRGWKIHPKTQPLKVRNSSN